MDKTVVGAVKSQEAREYPPLPRPTGWITNWKDFLARRDSVIYSYMWRPDGKPHPLDVQMFTAEQMRSYVDADRKARQQDALTEAQIAAGWESTFSTRNPFCPCDLRSFTKAVRWAEHAIRAAIAKGEQSHD